MPKPMSTDEVFSIDSTNNVSYVAQGIGISGNGRYITFSLRSPTLFTARHFTQIMAIDRNDPGAHHRCEWRLQWFRRWPQHLAKGVG